MRATLNFVFTPVSFGAEKSSRASKTFSQTREEIRETRTLMIRKRERERGREVVDGAFLFSINPSGSPNRAV